MTKLYNYVVNQYLNIDLGKLNTMTPETLALRTPEHSNPINHGFISDTLRRPLAIATGVLAMAGITSLATNTERANGAPEICTTLSGEEPQPQTTPKVAGVDLMTYKPAFRSELCAQFPNTATTYIENVGTKTAKGVQFSFTGISYVAKGLKAVRIDDQPVQILEFNQLPSIGEQYCTRVEFNKDWTYSDTTTLRCWDGLRQRDLDPGQKMKVEVDLDPQRASNPDEVGGLEVAFPKAPYVLFDTQDKVTPQTLPEDTGFNSSAVRLVYVRDAQGNSSQIITPACQTPNFSIKIPKVLPKRVGVLTSLLRPKTRVSGKGNGASKIVSQRAKAARIVVTTKAKTGKLPKDMLRVGNKIFIDIPASGIRANKPLIDRIPVKFSGNSVRFSAKFFGPRGTVASCNKTMAVASNSINSHSR